jgi:hypothetical protein
MGQKQRAAESARKISSVEVEALPLDGGGLGGGEVTKSGMPVLK